MSAVSSVLNLRLAYKVSYNDEVMGYVADVSQISEVETEVLSNIKADHPEDYVGATTARLSLTVGGRIIATDAVAENILNDEENVVPVLVLTVDGSAVLAVNDTASLSSVLDARLKSFADGCDEVSFVKNVDIETGYFPAAKVSTLAEARDYIKSLEVRAVKTESYVDTLAFETVKTESDSYIKGYRRVTSAGKNGTADVTATVTYINGVETAREIITSTTITEPVAQQEIVGTAVVSKSKAGTDLFAWPLARASRQYISSYYGDGRGHKGIDIVSPKNTAIYAAMGGTVTYASYRNDYGYHVVIDHGNGYKTLYAHACELNVSVGQVVERGETIAFVGSTGQSTGNHLHFEIYVNGVRINPIDYIEK